MDTTKIRYTQKRPSKIKKKTKNIMGVLWSASESASLSTPFPKYSKNFKGPTDDDRFFLDTGNKNSDKNIKFKYDISDDNWQWWWTPFNDELLWYTIKETYYQYNGETNYLPFEHENLRGYLEENDPIPPHILKQKGMNNNAYLQAKMTSICNVNELKCRFVKKKVGNIFEHPAIIIYKNEPKYNDDSIVMIHLMKSTQTGLVMINCESKSWQKVGPNNKRGWIVSNKVNYIQKDLTLLKIAKWCMIYESNNAKYV